ncbi:translation initiation factor eIF2 assembly protein-like [Diadema antillarum]|uniref:translation initiation factor eIF2 assembly protein-like n=1 Tax=Diadema antillarum TaxID=105358 RepID=UPI003A8B7CA2
MNRQQVLNCSFSSWYSNFIEHTIESEIIKLPQSFIDYLHADGIYLPRSKDELQCQQNTREEPSKNAPSFPELQVKVERAIKQLGGAVFPKLNWSAPRDASWIAFGNSLKCQTFNDIILLLKSSDFVTHDLTQPFETCSEEDTAAGQVQYELVLRRWKEIVPSMEFRVFVANQEVVAISQRDISSFFPCIPPMENDLTYEIVNFHDRYVSCSFPDDHYVFDIFRKSEGEYLILDFNPFNEVTDPLLFTWTELRGARDGLPQYVGDCQFRCIQEEAGVQPSAYLAYSMPTDFVDLTTGTDAAKLVDFLKMKKKEEEEDTVYR